MKEDGRQVDRDKSNLELSLGISSTCYDAQSQRADVGAALVFAAPNDKSVMCRGGNATGSALHHVGGGLGAKRWFSEAVAAGYVHPWSLAARQEKAAFEQQHLKANLRLPLPPPPAAADSRGPQPTPVVGWPPVRASRKNLANPPRPSKTDVGVAQEKEAKKLKTSEEDGADRGKELLKSAMFVKVHMEGFAVGRKIDLMAHDGYDSLSRALKRMFDNLFYVKSSSNKESDQEHDDKDAANLVLLYEDNEGDKMLVGDVPWEMFVASVKRLYLTHRSRTSRGGGGGDKGEEKL